MFNNSDNPNGTHTYGVYYDKPSKRYRAVGLTHLYTKDKKRFQQVSKGFIMPMKFKEFEVVSGVHNSFYDKNINGKPINLQDSNVTEISKRHLSKKQSDSIKAFAKRKIN